MYFTFFFLRILLSSKLLQKRACQAEEEKEEPRRRISARFLYLGCISFFSLAPLRCCCCFWAWLAVWLRVSSSVTSINLNFMNNFYSLPLRWWHGMAALRYGAVRNCRCLMASWFERETQQPEFLDFFFQKPKSVALGFSGYIFF